MKQWIQIAPNPQTPPPPPKGKGRGKNPQVQENKRPRVSEHTGSSSSSSSSVRDLALATADLSLQSARHIRQLWSLATCTILTPSHETVVHASHIPQGDTAEIMRWAILVTGLAAEPKVSPEDREMLRAHSESVSQPSMLTDLVGLCHVSQTFGDTNMFRIQFQTATALESVSKALVSAFVTLGGTVKYGPAPRSAAERLTAACLKRA
ncbi:unnamed protein product [Polarella glacialis]|uniref:Uncharacterized protein n=1 Tax=Polarella glacialis TaxID=89957 RepID=A0A813M0B8_POLGL|nr:unnamed protein product [Polarella glacialis]